MIIFKNKSEIKKFFDKYQKHKYDPQPKHKFEVFNLSKNRTEESDTPIQVTITIKKKERVRTTTNLTQLLKNKHPINVTIKLIT